MRLEDFTGGLERASTALALPQVELAFYKVNNASGRWTPQSWKQRFDGRDGRVVAYPVEGVARGALPGTSGVDTTPRELRDNSATAGRVLEALRLEAVELPEYKLQTRHCSLVAAKVAAQERLREQEDRTEQQRPVQEDRTGAARVADYEALTAHEAVQEAGQNDKAEEKAHEAVQEAGQNDKAEEKAKKGAGRKARGRRKHERAITKEKEAAPSQGPEATPSS